MTHRGYRRLTRFISRNYANAVATLALIIALTGTAAMASGVLVTSKTIKNGSILSQDIRKSAVKSSDLGEEAVQSEDIKNDAIHSADIAPDQVTGSDIGTGQVGSSDIGNGQVTPQDVTMPEPEQIKEGDVATLNPASTTFTKIDDVGSYMKEDPDSALQVDWTGSVEGHNRGESSGCIFQLRIDGQPPLGGGGEVFGKGVVSVAASALFPGLGPGSHAIEIWAKLALGEPSPGMENADRCTVGPSAAGISQTVVVSEQVL